jgi:hypothetical protein
MNLLLFILSVIDACGTALILWGPKTAIIGPFIIYFAYMILIKGIISVFTSFPLGFFDWMGILDTLAGIVLILISYGVDFHIFYIFAVIYSFKAAYCLFRTSLNI